MIFSTVRIILTNDNNIPWSPGGPKAPGGPVTPIGPVEPTWPGGPGFPKNLIDDFVKLSSNLLLASEQ